MTAIQPLLPFEVEAIDRAVEQVKREAKKAAKRKAKRTQKGVKGSHPALTVPEEYREPKPPKWKDPKGYRDWDLIAIEPTGGLRSYSVHDAKIKRSNTGCIEFHTRQGRIMQFSRDFFLMDSKPVEQSGDINRKAAQRRSSRRVGVPDRKVNFDIEDDYPEQGSE